MVMARRACTKYVCRATGKGNIAFTQAGKAIFVPETGRELHFAWPLLAQI
jgi:hypothetical protein